MSCAITSRNKSDISTELNFFSFLIDSSLETYRYRTIYHISKISVPNERMNALKQFLWIGLLMSLIQNFKSFDLASSSINIENFLQKEAHIITEIQDYFVQERERLDKLKMHQQEWKEWRDSNIKQESEYITIPQHLFHLFKRVTQDLDELENIMKENKYDAIDGVEPPTEDHIKRVILSLVDLQYQYDLKPEDIMNGTLLKLSLNESLSLDSCFLIAKTCSEQIYHRCVIDWLEICLSLSSDEKFAIDIYNLTYPSYIFLNQKEKAFEHTKIILGYDCFDTPASDTYMELGLQLEKLNGLDKATLEASRLCREHQHTNPYNVNLKCRYNHENSAFLKIAPLKEEELYHYPKILLYRDVIYDSEIEIIKNEATKKWEVARVFAKDGSRKIGTSYRISEIAYLEYESTVLTQFLKRLEDISDLSIKASEKWQVLNYPPGGFLALHNDCIIPNDTSIKTMGNRITTMLFYFNETTQGGETVFPRIGVSVKPAKGLAVVWHNLQSDGSRNPLTDHSACPVVMGEKWGFTQWIRSFNQTCLRKVYEYDPVISRGTRNNSMQFQKTG